MELEPPSKTKLFFFCIIVQFLSVVIRTIKSNFVLDGGSNSTDKCYPKVLERSWNDSLLKFDPAKSNYVLHISPKFLPPTCKILKKCTKKAKIVRYILQRLKIGRNFENMEKLIGFCGGRIWAKNRFMNFMWPLRTIYPQIWNISLNGIFAFRKKWYNLRQI